MADNNKFSGIVWNPKTIEMDHFPRIFLWKWLQRREQSGIFLINNYLRISLYQQLKTTNKSKHAIHYNAAQRDHEERGTRNEKEHLTSKLENKNKTKKKQQLQQQLTTECFWLSNVCSMSRIVDGVSRRGCNGRGRGRGGWSDGLDWMICNYCRKCEIVK